MATTNTYNATYPQGPRKTYMSIQAFNGSFFQYTTTQGPPPGFTVTGTLSAVTGATASNCPAGRTLRETGKKLYPSANPGVTTYMVGVYDANSGLRGFIDPNDSVFTVYNQDRPIYLPDSVSATDNTTVDKAPGVFSLGSVLAGTGIGYNPSTTSTAVTQQTNKSTAVTNDAVVGTITMNNATLNNNTSVSFTLNNTSITSGDYVLVKHTSVGALGGYSVTSGVGGNGSVVITVRNISGGNLGEAIVLQYFVLKAPVAV